MLNQFYDYMAKKLVDFLGKEQIQPGQRYFLQFDQEDNVSDFYGTLSRMPEAESFTYRHEQGSLYKTIALTINGVKVIVAATIEGVTRDFLVTVRNQVSDQADGWVNTAFIGLSHLSLDSIQGGGKDLQGKGMPFNISKVSGYIEEELQDHDNFSNAEKEIIRFHLQKKLEDSLVQTTIWDYVDIVSLLDKGTIEESDFRDLQLFPDHELQTNHQLKQSDIKERVEVNSRLFELVQRIHDYGTLNTELEKHFDEKMVSKLKRDDWHSQSLAAVKASYDDHRKKQLNYDEKGSKKLNSGIVYWERPASQTKAGQRKRNFIVFNKEKRGTVEMAFEFDDYLRKEFIHKLSEPYCTSSGKKLKVSLPAGEGAVTFHTVKYSHLNETKSSYTFNFCIVPCSQEELSGIEALYEVKVKKSESVISLNYTEDELSLGSTGEAVKHTVKDQYETINKEPGTRLSMKVDPGAWEDDRLSFVVRLGDTRIPFELKDSDVRSVPIDAKRVSKLKREKNEHFILDNDILRQGTSIYYPFEEFKQKLFIEKRWVDEGRKYVVDGSQREGFVLPESVSQAYGRYIAYFRDHDRLPSLSYMDDELKGLAREYIDSVIECIKGIEEDRLLTEPQRNLFRLGMYVEQDRLWLTPVHPLNVAYQLSLTEEIEDEELDYVILNRLHPNNLMPFLYSDGKGLYRPSLSSAYAEWHEYEPEHQISVGTANEFLAKVVEEKIAQFVSHFDYLFLESANSPILLNIVEINNDKEVARGIFNFLKKRLDAYGPEGMIPVEVALYRGMDSRSAFEVFSSIQTPAEMEGIFEVDLTSAHYDPVDVLRLIMEHIHYYRKDIKLDKEFLYSHISFFKLPTQDIDVSHPTNLMDTGLSLDGLLSSVVAVSSETDYRSGFGLLNAPEKKKRLIDLSASYNELAYNLKDEGRNSYTKGKSIVMSTSTKNMELLQNLYDSSAWVTFVDPGVDLDFFRSAGNELLVIHYNDQHTSSDRYDAITVTSKADQYKKVIKDYMAEKSYPISDGNINQAIKAFNSINGEWLLRIIGSKGHFAREKISIVSAMKYLESFLFHPEILWVPVSLEEILRVASVANLTKRDGIFSAQNLKSFGKHSDDILMMGVEERSGRLFLHLYPVEVKIGRLQAKKAGIQIGKTIDIFKEFLMDKRGEDSFRKKFYRNFFAQILLSNAKKIHSNGLWEEDKYEAIHRLKPKLVNDGFEIGEHLEPYIGQGAVFHFRNDSGFRSAVLENGIMKLMFMEEDAFTGLSVSPEELVEKMKSGYMDIVPEKLLCMLYTAETQIPVRTETDSEAAAEMPAEEDSDNAGMTSPDSNGSDTEGKDEGSIGAEHAEQKLPCDEETSPLVESRNKQTFDTGEEAGPSGIKDGSMHEETGNPEVPLREVRVPLGKVQGTNQVLHWEYGHDNLSNRHLFISGGSGQGKTYFIQCMLWELARKGISSIIIDYTDGFKKSQLEPSFKDRLGDRLEQFIVLANKFPINPFKRNKKELDEDLFIDEDDSDVAERMKNVIGSIYTTLGPQQLNAVYQAVMKGMSLYDEKMNFSILRDLLEEDGSGPAKTALSQMNLLIDKNPFDAEREMDWSFLEKEKGKVFIIQLTGYSPDVQKMITEFILWDLWYYKLQHGSKNIPFPTILDESQRLDFSIHSPSARILTEGRKFGWSGWFATQSSKVFSPDQVSRLQISAVKVYFSPVENEIGTIASNLSTDLRERKEWENRLANLKKGQCIVYGPALDKNGTLMPSRPYVVDILPFDERE